jgi:serine/threonine-protein kinase
MTGPEPGLEILPGLTLLRRLGHGGMGEAWLARDAELGCDVVAKLLPGDAPPERLALLRREARLVRKLKHPRIVPVYGFRAGERFCAVTLRHMTGGDAGARRSAAPAEIVRLGRDVADALAYRRTCSSTTRAALTSRTSGSPRWRTGTRTGSSSVAAVRGPA